jgi:hypothetical protein
MDTKELVKQMVINVLDGQPAEAQERFQDIIAVKVTDALEAQKQAVATSMYAQPETSEEE